MISSFLTGSANQVASLNQVDRTSQTKVIVKDTDIISGRGGKTNTNF